MKDPELRTLLGLTNVEAPVCAGCHAEDTPGIRPFDFKAMVVRVRHDHVESDLAPDAKPAASRPASGASPNASMMADSSHASDSSVATRDDRRSVSEPGRDALRQAGTP